MSAATGAPGAVSATTALLAGSVDPQSFAGTYAFELGVYQGAETVYGIIATGDVPAVAVVVGESDVITGLQPGTTYAYRIVIHGAHGEAVGAPVTFTTAGLPAVLAAPGSPAMLAIPSIAFPGEAKASVVKKMAKCAKRRKLIHGKCAKVKVKKRARGRKSKK